MNVDYSRADNDANIFGKNDLGWVNKSYIELRGKLLKFFESSEFYEPLAILEYMPPNYLIKERVLLLAKSKKYKEVFSLCIETL